MYLQFVSGSSFDDFIFTTSAPGQPLVGWTPSSNTYINKIEFQFGSRNVNVDFLWFIPRDSSHSNSNFWVSGNRTGTWSLNIHKSWNYNMSGVKLRTHDNPNNSAITCRVLTDLPKAITKPLKRIEINTPDIVISRVVKADVNLGGNKIKNVSNPTQDNEAVTKNYVDKLIHHTAVQPSHYNNQFASTGLSIGNVVVRKLSHRYSDSKGQAQFMYYHRIIVNFRKLSSGNKFFLHILVNIPQDGTDLAVYPRQFSEVYMITYGIMGTTSNLDPDKVYDYHTAFYIKPTEVVSMLI